MDNKKIDLKKNVELYKNYLNTLLDIDERYKGDKNHESKLRNIYKELEEIQLNIFNYIQQTGGKPEKQKVKRARGSYNKNNKFVDNHLKGLNDDKKTSKKSSKKQNGGNIEKQYNQIITQNNNIKTSSPFVKFDMKDYSNDLNDDNDTLLNLTELNPINNGKNNLKDYSNDLNDDKIKNIVDIFDNYKKKIDEYEYNSSIEYDHDEMKMLKKLLKDAINFIKNNIDILKNEEFILCKFLGAYEKYEKMIKNIKKQYK